MEINTLRPLQGQGKKLFVETYGCQMNVGDSEIVVSIMQNEGWRYTDDPREADVILINTCSIRDNAEQRIWGRLAELRGLRRLSSAAVRVARQAVGAARPVSDRLLRREGTLYSTLILAPPGAGKTTLLRDLSRAASDGEGMTPHRVGVADERGEVAALWNGRPQLEVGARTDVLEGCPKALALMLLLRAMNPQVLAADEITAPEDVRALISAAGCGAALLATAHGWDRRDLEERPLYRELMAAGVFRRLVLIRREGDRRRYEVEELP